MMRKPRAVVFDDDDAIRNLLASFFALRGYECLPFGDPASFCPVGARDDDRCAASVVCSDVLITDIDMPGVNGLDLLEHQQRSGCSLDVRNKAVISGDLHGRNQERLRQLGCSFFRKPFVLNTLSGWLVEVERRLDLSLPLSSHRRDGRRSPPR